MQNRFSVTPTHEYRENYKTKRLANDSTDLANARSAQLMAQAKKTNPLEVERMENVNANAKNDLSLKQDAQWAIGILNERDPQRRSASIRERMEIAIQNKDQQQFGVLKEMYNNPFEIQTAIADGLVKTAERMGVVNKDTSDMDKADVRYKIAMAKKAEEGPVPAKAPTTPDIINYNLSQKDPKFAEYMANKSNKALVDVILPGEESKDAFGEEIAKKGGGRLLDRHDKSRDLAKAMREDIDLNRLMDDGMITGFGSKFLIGAGKALSLAGFHEYDDAIANTEAYVAGKASQVGVVIKDFGAGTGLSDADREYAEAAAGGDIKLSEGSLRYINDIQQRRRIAHIIETNRQVENIPEKYRAFLNPIEIPAGYTAPNKDGMNKRVQELNTFNRVNDGEDPPFDTIAKIRTQMRKEGYPISHLTNDEITKGIVSSGVPQEESAGEVDLVQNFGSVEEAEAAGLPVGTEITINGRRAIVDGN